MATKGSVYSILQKKYPATEYALMAEVRDAAGFQASRSADYIAVNLWPSRGLHVNGIELKSFRGDWLSELKKPFKAENIYAFCDYWWLLTSDETVAKLEEIPVTWGWMTIKGERIFVKKDAPKLSPDPIDRHFLATLLKRACDKTNFVHIESIQDKIDQAQLKGEEIKMRRIRDLEDEIKALQKNIKEFEEASGIKLGMSRYSEWSYPNHKTIGAALQIIATGGDAPMRKKLADLALTAKDIHSQILTSLKALELKEEINV